MFTSDNGKTIDDMISGFERKLNMIGKDVSIRDFYKISDNYSLVSDDAQGKHLHFNTNFASHFEELSDRVSKIFGGGTGRQLILNQSIITGKFRYFAKAFNITTVIIDSSQINYIEYGFLSDTNVKNIIFIGEEPIDQHKNVAGYTKLIKHNKKIEKVYFPDGMTELTDDRIVGCSNLTEVSLPESFNKYNTSAFSGCNALKDIRIRCKDRKSGKRVIKVYKLRDGIIRWKECETIS